jgi:hypothetical protein
MEKLPPARPGATDRHVNVPVVKDVWSRMLVFVFADQLLIRNTGTPP